MLLNLLAFAAVASNFDVEAAAAAGRGEAAADSPRHPTLSVVDSIAPGVRITPRLSSHRGSSLCGGSGRPSAASRASRGSESNDLGDPLIGGGGR